jgi:hypothetical protein
MRALVLACIGCSTSGVSPSDARLADAPADVMLDGGGPIPTAGLVAAWLFNKDASDSSGHGYVATVHGATLTDDRFGRPMSAYHFDGISQTIEIADSPTLALTGDATFSAWIKPDSFPRLAGIISKYQMSADASYTLRLGFAAPYSYYDFDNVMLNAPAPPPQIVTGQWQHVAVVITNGTVTIYANGAPGPVNAANYAIMTNTRPLYIGVDFSTRFFAGAIDDIRLYSRALQPFEIQALYSEHP